MNTFITARKGEELVANLLPNALWINKEHETKTYYDILWEGIKIDVKTSSESRVTEKGFVFASYDSFKTIFVLVGLTTGNPYLWVVENNHTTYFKLEDAVQEEDLGQTIKDMWELKLSRPLTKWELAAYLGCYYKRVEEWAEQGAPYESIKGVKYFYPTQVEQWLTEMSNVHNYE